MQISNLNINFGKEQRKVILERIEECLTNGKLSQGKYVELFEKEFANMNRCKHAIAVNSGSSAIEIAMRILDVAGKEVLVPTNTFLATATAVRNAGGRVRLVDTARDSLLVNLDEIKRRRTDSTVGVVLVHIGGFITPDIFEIRSWCKSEGIWLFEDAAHAHGSEYQGVSAGTFGIAGGYSFFATKIITSGEGGILVTNNNEVANKARLYRNHGKIANWRTYSTLEGFNYRMSEITACLALTQLQNLDKIIKRRVVIANKYLGLLKGSGIKVIKPLGKCGWYKFVIVFSSSAIRDKVKQELEESGIELQGEIYAIPLHKQPIANKLGWDEDFPNADDICSRHLCLPIYPDLKERELHYVISKLLDSVKGIKEW